jgi:hypothetical protein
MSTFTFPIERGPVLFFARAIGDHDPSYYGLEGEPVVPPPTFLHSCAQFEPDYHLRPNPRQPWFGSGRDATGDPEAAAARSISMHAEQHFEFHRPVTTGEVLLVSRRDGDSWTKRSRHGNTLHFTELVTEYRAQDGGLVATGRTVAVRVMATGEA